MKRPLLTTELDGDTFLRFYYLKEELVAFCREHSLDYNDGKITITNRIYHYLENGEKINSKIKTTSTTKINISQITHSNYVEHPFACTEMHRKFFTSIIGSSFKFNVAFQKYLKDDTKKTYAQAIGKWYEIEDDRKKNKGKSKIAKQFEYNTYIRDFFASNKNYTIEQAIKCWKYKKSLPGHNKYECVDLKIL